MRELTSHKVNPANNELTIEVLDEPGPGGACHLYKISGFSTGTNPSDPFKALYGTPALHSTVLFQNGAIKEVGVNGVTHEALLAILIDRLEAFQAGLYACIENDSALHNLKLAQDWLASRTMGRMARGARARHTG